MPSAPTQSCARRATMYYGLEYQSNPTPWFNSRRRRPAASRTTPMHRRQGRLHSHARRNRFRRPPARQRHLRPDRTRSGKSTACATSSTETLYRYAPEAPTGAPTSRRSTGACSRPTCSLYPSATRATSTTSTRSTPALPAQQQLQTAMPAMARATSHRGLRHRLPLRRAAHTANALSVSYTEFRADAAPWISGRFSIATTRTSPQLQESTPRSRSSTRSGGPPVSPPITSRATTRNIIWNTASA